MSSVEFDCLECSICIEQAKDPTSLHTEPGPDGMYCSHNFCEACIMRVVRHAGEGRATCPMCRKDIFGLMPNLVARELLVRLNERKGLVEHHQATIRRLEDRVQQLTEVNAESEADINRLRQESHTYKGERERVLQKMHEFEQRLAGQQNALESEKAALKEDAQRRLILEQNKIAALQEQLNEVRILHHAASPAAPIPGAQDPAIAQSPQAGGISARSLAASWIARTLRSTLSAGSSMISSVLWNPIAPGPLVRPYIDFKLQERRGAMPTSPVWRALDSQAGVLQQNVALKKLHFEGAGVTAFREPFLLFQLEHDNLLRLRALTRPSAVGFAYLIFDFYEADLEYFLSSGCEINASLVRDIFWRLLQVLRYLHEADVVHMEIKPTSLLFSSHRALVPSEMRLCSFGNARSLHTPAPQALSTSSIQHWAPELLLQDLRHLQHWKAVDVFAAGCLLAQLHSPAYAPLFGGMPSPAVLLSHVCAIQETKPPPEAIANSATLQNIDAKIRSSKATTTPLAQRLRAAPPAAIDLLSQLLCFDASRRLSVARSQTHEYFSDVDRKAQKAFARPVSPGELRDENILTFLQEQCADLC